MPANANAAPDPHERQPHPMEAQIRELLAQGLNNAQIIEQTYASPRVVAQVRKEAGIEPAPRSTWRRKPHPKAEQINDLLGDGFNDAEIGRRTGADVSTIARMRADGGYGKPTLARKPRQHPRYAEIRALLSQHSSEAIARQLGVDRVAVRRIRAETGIECAPAGFATPQEKWQAHARSVDGGHLEWTGERAKRSGTPVMRFKEESYSPAALAFEMRHGRPAEGHAKAECGMRHCIAPDHVADEVERRRIRLEARERSGLGDLPAKCVYGHDMAVHGKLEIDGRAYCGRCKVLDKRAQRDPSQPRRTRPRPTSLDEAFRARTEPLDGGHVRWTGSTSHGTPTVRFENNSYSAYKVAFRAQYGRDPEGLVTSTCDMPGCVSGWHVADRPMREKTDAAFAAIFGEAA